MNPYQRNFFNDMGNIFAFPFKPQGIAAIVMGGIFFGIATFIAKYTCFGWIISVVVTAYLLTYEFKIINAVANGEEDVPGWPDFGNAFSTLFLVIGTYLICFGPCVACLIIGVIAGIAAGPLAIPFVLLSLLLFLAGAFYFPMAYMITAMFTTPGPAMNVSFGFKSIGRILPEYIVVFLITVAFFGFPLGVGFLFQLAGIMGPGAAAIASVLSAFVTMFLSLYLRIANGYMLGRLYWTCEHKLQWFPGTEKVLAGPPPRIYGQPDAAPRPGPAGEPLPPRQGGEGTGLHTRRQAPDLGTARYVPTEDPFHKAADPFDKFREEKIGEQAGAAGRKGEDAFENLMDKAHSPSKPTRGLERGGKPADGDLPDRQPAQGGGELAGRRSSFYTQPGDPAGPPTQQGTGVRRPTGAHRRPTGAQQRPTGAHRRPTAAHRRPTGAHPAPGAQQPPPSPFQPPPATDDHTGPVRFSPEVQALIDSGEFGEARRVVEQKRETARNMGNLAEISFYRKQLDIIDLMEKA